MIRATLHDMLPVVCDVVRRAGAAVLRSYGRSSAVHYKEPNDAPVTAADFASQRILLAGLAPFCHPILSEEQADDGLRRQHPRVWIVDPLDGTKEFLQQTGEFCVMVGLAEHGRPVLGVVYLPTEDALFFAVRGGGAWVQRGNAHPVPLAVVHRDRYSESTILVSRHHLLPTEVALAERCGFGRSIACGSAGVKACRVASGDADLFLNSSDRTGEWDTCAPECVVREAGGRMTDMRGRELVYNKLRPMNPRGFIIAHPTLHARVLADLHAMAGSVDV